MVPQEFNAVQIAAVHCRMKRGLAISVSHKFLRLVKKELDGLTVIVMRSKVQSGPPIIIPGSLVKTKPVAGVDEFHNGC